MTMKRDPASMVTLSAFQGPWTPARPVRDAEWMLKQVQHDEVGDE